MTVRTTLPALTLLLAQPAIAQVAPQEPASTAEPENPSIVVMGRLPHCQPRPDDPLDSVDLSLAPKSSQARVIRQDPATGIFGVSPDHNPVTGPGIWQRVGTGIDQYIFRVPEDGSPLCIGARNGGPRGWAQLRQVVDAAPYHGKIVRVTMWAATNKAGRVWFWIASGRQYRRGSSRGADMATHSGNIDFRGSHTWTPVSLEMGPIRCDQVKMSFGFMLDGPGDLWVYKPQIEVIGTQSAKDAKRDCRALEGKRG